MDKIVTITPSTKLGLINPKELFQYKDLLITLAERDIKLRYKQTLIGGLWAILQPFTMMVVFTVFFGKVVKLPSEEVPYALFSYAGLLLWTYFSNTLTNASNSLIGSESLITKVYFPRYIIPLSVTFVGLIDYLVTLLIVFGLMVYYQVEPSFSLVLLPVTLFFTWVLASGLGFWLSAINVKYRDVRYALPFFIRLLLFVTPVIYPVSMAGSYAWLLKLNPLSGLVETHRVAILSHQPVNWELLAISSLATVLVFLTGSIYFKAVERDFADVI